ncbi:MAG: beta-galactosidase [Candidatus Zipacnadales bacterium]
MSACMIEAQPRSLSVQLDPLYFERCCRPCEFVGFSFEDTPQNLMEMRNHGANALGSGAMWIPTQDPEAPYGCGPADLTRFEDTLQLGQSFTTQEPITAVAFCTPTYRTTGSGCVLSLYRSTPQTWGETPPVPIASEMFTDVEDCQRLWLVFTEVPPGTYYVEQSLPMGAAIGVWATRRDTYAGGQAYVNRQPRPSHDLELWCRTISGEKEIVPPTGDHQALRLGKGVLTQLAEMGFCFDFAVGNWNNGGFPYYPEWFIERFPDHVMLDQNGEPILAGMFGKLAPWPSINHPVIVDGTRRHIRAVVELLKDNPNLLYWTLGGEALYATYIMPNRWTDYSANAVAHYRAWLQREYGSIAALNEAWGTHFHTFADISPPTEPGRDLPTLDWFRYRNEAMAERFAWHFTETKGADPERLAMTCNHGNIFQGMAATWLGQDMALFAGVSDGWEMGQIISDEDSDLYNLMWMRSAGAYSKPLCPVRLAYKKSDPRARGGGTSYTPEAARRYFWECVGTGAWHMGFIQWSGSLPDGEWGIQGTPAQAEIRAIFEEWHRIEHYFDDMWPVKGKLGLYFSQLTWTLDGFQPIWTELHKCCTQAQIDYRILTDHHLLEGDLRGLVRIVSADNRIISEACVKALQDFVAGGGELVVLGENGIEDEHLRRRPRLPLKPTPMPEELIKAIDDRPGRKPARLLHVACQAEGPYLERVVEETLDHHTIAFDIGAHRSIGQTFTLDKYALRAVSVSNPTYTKTLREGELTLELRKGGPGGESLGRKTYGPSDLTDNAWHELPLEEAAPPGIYYLRLTVSEGMPVAHLGVWGTLEDRYNGGSLYIDDAPAAGDLRMKLLLEKQPEEANGAIESFALSDGLNVIVVLTNVSGVPIKVTLESPRDLLLPGRSYTVSELLIGTHVGRVRPMGTVPFSWRILPYRSAILYFAAQVREDVVGRLHNLEGRLKRMPQAATAPHRAHLKRAQDALAANREEKALASLLRAEERAPLEVTAEIRSGTLSIRAHCSDAKPNDPFALTAVLIPLPNVRARLERSSRDTFIVDVPLEDLGERYDYTKRQYLPYWGAVEVQVTGTVGHRIAAAAGVVHVPPA